MFDEELDAGAFVLVGGDVQQAVQGVCAVLEFSDGGGASAGGAGKAAAVVEDLDGKLVVFVPDAHGHLIGARVLHDVVEGFLEKQEEVAFGFDRELGVDLAGLAFEVEAHLAQQPVGGLAHAFDQVADRVVAAFPHPDDVTHGERAFACDAFHFAEVVRDFLGSIEADQVLACAACDE